MYQLNYGTWVCLLALTYLRIKHTTPLTRHSPFIGIGRAVCRRPQQNCFKTKHATWGFNTTHMVRRLIPPRRWLRLRQAPRILYNSLQLHNKMPLIQMHKPRLTLRKLVKLTKRKEILGWTLLINPQPIVSFESKWLIIYARMLTRAWRQVLRLSLFVELMLELHLDATGPKFYSCSVLQAYITFV